MGTPAHHKALEDDTVFESCIFMSCSASHLFKHFVFVATYLENAASQRFEDGTGNFFFTATLQIWQKIVR
jgi:hypothetical protein